MSSTFDEIQINALRLIPDNAAVLVGVSGGIDSMVLLDCLQRIAIERNLRLVIAHLNHGLRGRESNREQKLVEHTAKELKIKIVVGKWERNKQEIKKYGLEMAARNARFAFFLKAAGRHRCNFVATGHHLNDRVESFFWRLFRGAGGIGLGGIKEENKFPEQKKIRFVRPLLSIRKSKINNYAVDHNISFRIDSSNSDIGIVRNRIRNRLLPYLRKNYVSEVDLLVNQSQELIESDTDYVKKQANIWLHDDKRQPFDKLHTALQRWIIWLQLVDSNIDPQFFRIESLRKFSGKPFSINPRQTVHRDVEGILHIEKVSTLKFSTDIKELHLKNKWEHITMGSTKISCKLETGDNCNLTYNSDPNEELFDADSIGPIIQVRHWNPGDRFQPIGIKTAVKIKNLFTNDKLPAIEKRRRLIANNENGEIFWVQGLRIGEIAKVHNGTKRLLLWRWQES